MVAAESNERSIRWPAPLLVACFGTIADVLLWLSSVDLGFLASTFLVVPLTGLLLAVFVFKGRRKSRWISLVLLCSYLFCNWPNLMKQEALRSEARWLTNSRKWREKVLESPACLESGMRFVLWDGWGEFGSDTNVYLVYSPKDELRNYTPASLSGLPRPVWRVHRLERDWYSVTFYTNDGFDPCSDEAH